MERHLLASLAEILSPNVLACYVDREIQFLAAESSDVAQTREYLKNKKTMLEEGQDAFVVAMEEHV